MGNIFFINETPIKDFNFTKKDTDIEKIIEENCQKENGLYSYSDCDFVLSKNDELPYFPNNSIILSFKVKKEKSFIQEMEIKAKYFDESFNYKRNYYYKNEKIEKIITSIEDDASKNSYEDNFIMEKL